MADAFPPPERKATYVRAMFGRIARHYDLMNRLMTFGCDKAWRRYVVAQALPPSPLGVGGGEGKVRRILDVATGTGDLALEALRRHPDLQAVGLDFVPEMLAQAQQKAVDAGTFVHLLAGDALCVPFGEGVFDAVVTGFALRNVTDIPAAFSEMARVTRPGGRIACLEIAKPRLPLFRHLYAFYFYRLVPLLGGWIAGQRLAYTYLPHSLTAFLAPDEIASVMRRTGWCNVNYRWLMLGTVVVHVGVREPQACQRRQKIVQLNPERIG
jgi:demethylmenaquinone methyltransferase / 2-methoxy-6-polyprenyl-1,4-benzoquinol methylase